MNSVATLEALSDLTDDRSSPGMHSLGEREQRTGLAGLGSGVTAIRCGAGSSSRAPQGKTEHDRDCRPKCDHDTEHTNLLSTVRTRNLDGPPEQCRSEDSILVALEGLPTHG